MACGTGRVRSTEQVREGDGLNLARQGVIQPRMSKRAGNGVEWTKTPIRVSMGSDMCRGGGGTGVGVPKQRW